MDGDVGAARCARARGARRGPAERRPSVRGVDVDAVGGGQGRRDRRRGACRRAARTGRGRARRPGAGTRRSRRRRCRRTTIVRSTRAGPAAPSRPLVSCRKATSPISSAVGRPAAEGHPDGGGHDAVDAVGAPVGEHPHAVAGPAVPLDVAHRHRRRHHQRRRRRAAAPSSGAGDARLGRLGVAGQHARRWPPGPARSAALPAGPATACRTRRCRRFGAARRTARSGRPRRRTAAECGRGSIQRRRGGHLHLDGARAPPATGRAPSTPAARPRRSTTSGVWSAAKRSVAQQRVEGGRPSSARGSRQPDRGSASTGQPDGRGQPVHGRRVAAAAAGHDHAPPAVEQPPPARRARRVEQPAARTTGVPRRRRRRGPAGSGAGLAHAAARGTAG